MENIKFIGIDQSYASCGVVVLDKDGIIDDTFRITSSKDAADSFKRAWDISQSIDKIANKYRPCVVGIEGLAYAMRGNATRDLAGLLFTIVSSLRFRNNDLPVHVVAPLTVKKFATGSGRANKQQMYNSLPELTKKLFLELGYKKTKGLPDIVDAYWIAEHTRQNYKDKLQTEFSKEYWREHNKIGSCVTI